MSIFLIFNRDTKSMGKKTTFFLLATLFFCIVCGIISVTKIFSENNKENDLSYCTSSSLEGKDEKLLGEWIAEPGTGIDRITLFADHTYEQAYSNSVTQVSFRENSNIWKTKKMGGITYLYMTNMHKCDSFEDICLLPHGGGGNNLWINFCTNEIVQMPGHVILIVLDVNPGDIYYPTSDLKLCHFVSDVDTNMVCFRRDNK